MSLVALAIVSVAVTFLIVAGIVIGWMVGTNDLEIDILAKRLAAEQRMTAATRETLAAIRDLGRRYSR